MEEANDFRTRVESALEAPASFEGVSLLPGFQGQQHRKVQLIRPHRIRQCRQPTGFREPGLGLCYFDLFPCDLGLRLRHLGRFLSSETLFPGREPPPAGQPGEDNRRNQHSEQHISTLSQPSVRFLLLL